MTHATPTSDYPTLLGSLRQAVISDLEAAESVIAEVVSSAPGQMPTYLSELVSHPGKKMRATFLILIAQARGNYDKARTAKVAASIELLHLATLVHDDIIDNSELRRNQATAHKKWGTRLAVLLGDYALSKSLELIIDDVERRIPASVSRASSQLIAGEILEIERWGKLDLSLEAYFEVIYGKTASLWETCGECGGLLAGFEPSFVNDCMLLGKQIGLAFQIIDDLLDYGVGAMDLGKSKNSDLQNGLVTLPLILYFQKANPTQADQMKALIAGSSSQENHDAIHAALDGLGCFADAKKMALDNIESSMAILQKFPTSDRQKLLLELCELMAHRSA